MRTSKSLLFALAMSASLPVWAVDTYTIPRGTLPLSISAQPFDPADAYSIDLSARAGTAQHPMFIAWPGNWPLPVSLDFGDAGMWSYVSGSADGLRRLYENAATGEQIWILFLK